MQNSNNCKIKNYKAKPGAGAGGMQLKLLNIRISFTLYFGKLKLEIVDAAVHDGDDQETILFGLTDWIRNKVEFRSENDFLSPGKIIVNGTPIDEFWKHVDRKNFWRIWKRF